MNKKQKRGPVIPWDTQPPPESPKDGGQRQVMKLVVQQQLPDSVVTKLPSSQTHEQLNYTGSFRAKRHPGAE